MLLSFKQKPLKTLTILHTNHPVPSLRNEENEANPHCLLYFPTQRYIIHSCAATKTGGDLLQLLRDRLHSITPQTPPTLYRTQKGEGGNNNKKKNSSPLIDIVCQSHNAQSI